MCTQAHLTHRLRCTRCGRISFSLYLFFFLLALQFKRIMMFLVCDRIGRTGDLWPPQQCYAIGRRFVSSFLLSTALNDNENERYSAHSPQQRTMATMTATTESTRRRSRHDISLYSHADMLRRRKLTRRACVCLNEFKVTETIGGPGVDGRRVAPCD